MQTSGIILVLCPFGKKAYWGMAQGQHGWHPRWLQENTV